MSIKEFTKSGTFVLVLLGAALIGVPFAAEQIGETTGLFKFPVTRWVKGVFAPKSASTAQTAGPKVDWKKELEGLTKFSEWANGNSEAKISIVRQTMFQIVRADSNPATSSRVSWKLLLISETLDVDEVQIADKLVLMCDPIDRVSGGALSVKPLGRGEKGFLVTVDNVRGEGKMGLSYDRLPPVYYDVKLRRMWLVPVASCRSEMKRMRDGKEEVVPSQVFFPGIEKGLSEGDCISPGNDKCGYRILSISDRCVWFEALYDVNPSEDVLPKDIWPDFSRIDTMAPTPPPGRLIFGRNRCFWPGDAIKLPNSGVYLMVDDFIFGRAVVFRLLNSAMLPVRELLCVIVREK